MGDRCSRRDVILGAAAMPLALAAPPAQAAALALQGQQGWLFFAPDGPQGLQLGSLARIAGLWREAAQLLESRGTRTVFALIPAKFRIYPDMLPAGMAVPPEAERRYAMGLEELRRAGHPAPDLAAAMQAQRRAAPAVPLFFRADTHWTPAGAAVAVAEVARAAQGLRLPPSRTPGARLGPAATETRLRRDLVEFVPAEDRAKYPSEAFTIRRPVARGGLLDDAPADTVLLGPSHLHPDFNVAPELSAALHRPVSLHWRTQNVGPFAAMLEWLRVPVFRRDRPKLLVWALLESALATGPENRGAFPQHAMSGAEFLDGVRQALPAA